MNRHQQKQLIQEFMSLTPSERLIVTTVVVSSRSEPAELLGSFSYYFAYELLDIRSLTRDNSTDPLTSFYFQVVSRRELPCAQLASESRTLLELYHYLSATAFRVQDDLFFDRMCPNFPEALSAASNPLARLAYHRDVFCLCNIGAEGDFLAKASKNASKMARQYRSGFTGDGDEQRAIQAYLLGKYTREVQLYFPSPEREILFGIARATTPPPAMSPSMDLEGDCSISSSEMSSEDEEFLQQLRAELLAKEGEQDRDYEEKDRSREKQRRYH